MMMNSYYARYLDPSCCQLVGALDGALSRGAGLSVLCGTGLELHDDSAIQARGFARAPLAYTGSITLLSVYCRSHTTTECR